MAFPKDVSGCVRWVQARRDAPPSPRAPLVSTAAPETPKFALVSLFNGIGTARLARGQLAADLRTT
eukprot:8802556-Pyramimonas_sp.AAC.1